MFHMRLISRIMMKPTTFLLVTILMTGSHTSYSYIPSRTISKSICEYNFLLRSIRRKRKSDGVTDDSNNNNRSNPSSPPGYQFFQGDGSYVPDGLSREQYDKLKKEELDKEKNMKYGAWGPRFKQTDAPDGDWMIMPNLWTAGRVNRPSSRPGGSNGMNEEGRRPITALFQTVRKLLTSFVLMYMLIDCLQIMVCMWKWKEEHMNAQKALLFTLETLLFRKKLFRLTVMKAESIKVIVSFAAAPLVNLAIERLSRSCSWSKTRISLVTLSSAVGLIGLWRLILRFIPFA
ncbi:hypothetical protein IV203_027448 [Nitzschia inconspicua]|uniref:Uncharacterized protein n=1 Tax=Nitzschia inconspicua TaxID=303405 RepID=A0A9K3Q3D1_9STRA|nr:hypothetical protein IV203_027448 [Nitzschia inconspicua]